MFVQSIKSGKSIDENSAAEVYTSVTEFVFIHRKRPIICSGKFQNDEKVGKKNMDNNITGLT